MWRPGRGETAGGECFSAPQLIVDSAHGVKRCHPGTGLGRWCMDERALTIPVGQGPQTFLYSEPDFEMRLERADIAFLGIPYGSGYSFAEQVPDSARAPAAMRAATSGILRRLDSYDFDLGGTLYDGQNVRAVDCGDVRAEVGAPRSHIERAEQAVRRILDAGALPIVLGGDHAIPIPVLRAYAGDSITLIQIDQHIDWREEVAGVRDGLSSPMRRAAVRADGGEKFVIRVGGRRSPGGDDAAAGHPGPAPLVTPR